MTPRTVGLVAATVVGVGLVAWVAARPPDLERRAQMLEVEVGRALAQAGVRPSRMVHESRTLAHARGRTYHTIERTYQCPPKFSPERFVKETEERLSPMGFEVMQMTRRRAADGVTITMSLGFRRYPLYALTLQEPSEPAVIPTTPTIPVLPPISPGHAKIAVVLDDWGYSRQLVPDVLQINRPLTLAILPHQRYSAAIAEAVQGSRCEVILHMPMEPRNTHSAREPHVLAPGMPPTVVRTLLDEALATVPHSLGVSNHQGSKATTDPALMRTVLNDLHRRHLLFLDSMVTDDSVCPQLARQIGIPFAQRAVFLDNVETPEAVRQKLLELVETARHSGSAVGIGHDKRVTIAVLQELMPQLEQQGIEFVPISELAKAQ